MKTFLFLFIFSFLSHFCWGQVIPSSCSAADSIISKYKSDADRLAVRRIYADSLTYIDSIRIPQSCSDSMLNALIAVYNAISLPARDTVVKLFDIHTFPIPDINSFSVAADSNLTWMQNLRNNIIPTGTTIIDSLMTLYNLSVDGYCTYQGSFDWHEVILKSDSNLNIAPLAYIFETVPGVFFADPLSWVGDGNDISASILSEYIELIYSVGWGDCPCGCIWRRYWKFNIYYDCSVEYIGSYGAPLSTPSIYDNNSVIQITPNPFQDLLYVDGLIAEYEYAIYNIMGQKLIQGKTSENRIINLNGLPSGQYLILLQSGGYIRVHKLVKR